MFKLDAIKEGEVLILKLEGILMPKEYERISSLIDGNMQVIIDMRNLTHIHYRLVKELLQTRKRLIFRGGDLKFVCDNLYLLNILLFGDTEFDIEVYKNLSEAKRSLHTSAKNHVPALIHEVIDFLNLKDDGAYLDCTVGTGGHAEAILNANKRVTFYGLDRDKESLERAQKNLEEFKDRINLFHANFKNIDNMFQADFFDGILFDLGLSSFQLDDPSRGFAYRFNSPLDMRMDRNESLTCEKLLKSLDQNEVERILRNYGEERFARQIARRIKERNVVTTAELRQAVLDSIPGKNKEKSLSRVFQAFRIAVNDELENLKQGLVAALKILKSGGRIVIISYHSLEDRIVKHFLREEDSLLVLTKKVVRPQRDELLRNPRVRSARLRAAEKQ
ncbi:MAG TPA: 16S rRNA (cytosine(1402)-N(4))-methyltransferase RsmH [bacterium (Candidatus Stahlbacteria)]|nr:16S rRNA (cytosine(1402)-N(4))-methyltransferase RsmH [Candidatus Stahlbacteria bacterium]